MSTRDVVHFELYSEAEILAQSACEVRASGMGVTRDGASTVNDTRLGSHGHEDCATCKLPRTSCPGHFGHIRLATPLYHPLFMDQTLKLLRCVCHECGAYRRDPSVTSAYPVAKRLSRLMTLCKATTKCPACECRLCWYSRSTLSLRRQPAGDAPFTAQDALRILSMVTGSGCLGIVHPERMILTVMIVPSTAVRPGVFRSSGTSTHAQDDLTVRLQDIVKCNNRTRDGTVRSADALQGLVCAYMDKERPTSTSRRQCKSVSERIRGKAGRMRRNVMGKRCDFSSRSVITPDARLDIDELGVPSHVALIQTVPVRVTAINARDLTRRVRLGWVLGGAKYINTGTRLIDVSVLSPDKRRAVVLKTGWVVDRVLQDGDWVLFNRQPSLHKESIMGHRVRIVRSKSFMLPVPTTTPYNADFDGDEMNCHVVQVRRSPPSPPSSPIDPPPLLRTTSQWPRSRSSCR